MIVRCTLPLLMIVAWCGFVTAVAWTAETQPAPVDATISSTSAELLFARSLDGQDMTFADLLGDDGKAVCFTFLHPACPLAQRYGNRAQIRHGWRPAGFVPARAQ